VVQPQAAIQQQASIPPQTDSDGGSYLRAEDYRVARIVHRLGTAGRALCEERIALSGLLFHHLADYAPGDRASAAAQYRIDRGMGVLAVMPRSAASAAGVRAGDVVVAVNGAQVPDPAVIAAQPRREQWRPLTFQSESMIEGALQSGPARLTLLRGSDRLDVTVQPDMGCPARSRLARSNQSSAYADGRYTIMTTGFLDFFRTDEELAVAMAHELAHNILRHPADLDEQGVPYGLFRHIGRNARLVRQTEIEADRLGVRLLAAAGYDPEIAIAFWRRYYTRLDARLQVISAHPGLRAREQLIREVMAELRAERQ
jgi:hypothetical protein